MAYTREKRAENHAAGKMSRGWVDDSTLLNVVLTNPGWTAVQIAAHLNLNAQTIRRRLKMPDFAAKLAAEKSRVFGEAQKLAADETVDSIRQLVTVRDDPKSSPAAVVTACSRLIDIALSLEDRAILLTRLRAAEALIEAHTTGEPAAEGGDRG